MSDKNPRPDWRQPNKRTPAGAKTTGGAANAGAGKRDWQKQTLAPAGPKKPWSRGAKLGLGVVLLSLFVGMVYIVIEWIRPISPACIVLVGSSYDDNLAVPNNVLGWKNLDDLAKLKDEPGLFSQSGKPNLLHHAPDLKGDGAWKKEWDKFARQIREKTVVLSLALHGAADTKEPYFFVNEDKGYSLLRLSELLQSLDSVGDRNVVLLIEPTLARANWSAGVFNNTFVERLLENRAKLKPKLFVLCASDAHQISWPSDEWQQTVFGHYVIEGLKGGADADKNQRITAGELFRFVKDRVTTWSQANRGIEQTPIFLGDERAADDVEIAQVAKSYEGDRTESAPGLNEALPESLDAAWRTWATLQNNTPHPSVYSPSLWRKYQDTLVRYEQLLRAGDPTKKTIDLAGRLAGMEKTLKSEARFDIADPVLSLSLPMASTLGVPLPVPDAEFRKRLQQVWESAKEEQRPEAMTAAVDWAKKQDDVRMTQVRTQAYRALLGFIANSKTVSDADLVGPGGEGESRSKAQVILDLYDVKLNAPRPAEVHFATMLLKDVVRPASPEFDLLRKAIVTRQAAERAALASPEGIGSHPYSEILYPWLREGIVRADAARRPGEDYLFGSTKNEWASARRLLEQADAGYAESQKLANVYRFALDTRDRATADLPYQALWVANQRVSSDKSQVDRVDDWVTAITLLGQRIEALQSDLGKETAPSAVTLRGLADAAVESRLNLQKSIELEIAKINIDEHSHILWLDREAILATPPLLPDQAGANAVDVRLQLLRHNRATSATFFKTPGKSQLFGGKAKDDADALAQRNLKLGLAVFKPFFPLKIAGALTESPAAIGETVAGLVKRWPDELHETLQESLKQGKLSAARAMLATADFSARGLPGGFDEKRDPTSVSQALRSIRMHDLFVAMAERSILDHWFAEMPADPPYYESSADAYLKVARQLAQTGRLEGKEIDKHRLSAVNAMQETARTTGLTLAGKSLDFWTSEKEFPVRWTIEPPASTYLVPQAADNAPPPAVAVCWRELDGPAAWKDPTAKDRKAIELTAQANRPEAFRLTKTGADAVLKTSLNVLLRGQRLQSKTEISQKDPDLVVHEFPRPERSFVKVRMAPDFTYGAVSIAFDISGSMIWKKGFGIDTPKGRKTRFELALVALESTLRIIPDGTYVSLIAFVTKDGKDRPDIVDVQKPLPWRLENLDGVLDRLKQLADQAYQENNPKAQGSTPIAHTIVECYRRGFPGAGLTVRGPRVILALSDGDDTSSEMFNGERWPEPEGKDQKRRNELVASYVSGALSAKDVEVHVVCFLDPTKYAREAANAEAQFAGVTGFSNPGSFIIQPRPELLAQDLQMAIRPRLVVEQGGLTPAGFPMFASLPKDEWNWMPLAPGQYSVRVKGSAPRDLNVAAGDMIPIVLRRDVNNDRKILYEREMFADASKESRPLLADERAMNDRYRVAVLQNQFSPKTNQLTQLVDIEEARAATLIQQTSPRFVWLESKPKTQPRGPMRWYREFGYPTLAYRILGADWPAPTAIPEMSVWLTDTPESETYARPHERSLKQNKSAKVTLNNEQYAVVEDVTLEEKDVIPSGLGKLAAPVPKQCLVVRVEHAPGKPVFVQLQGKGKANIGEEHHYFPTANKYTALFWDLPNTDQDTVSFNIIFLDALKTNVTPATFTVPGRNTYELPDRRMGP